MADASGSFSTDTASPVVADLLDSAYIDVKFTPWGVGDVGAVLRMTANGQNYDVYLGGKGSRPSGENDSSAPAFSKQSVNFGTVAVNYPKTENITISNLTGGEMEIVSIDVINNVTKGIFSINDNGCAKLYSNADTCMIIAASSASTAGTYEGSIEFKYKLASDSQTVKTVYIPLSVTAY